MTTTLERIIKILNLAAGNANPHERAAALAKAKEVITSSNIFADLYDPKILVEALSSIEYKVENCPVCGNEFRVAWGDSEASPEGTIYGRPRRYCTDACKQKAYRERKAKEAAKKGKAKR